MQWTEELYLLLNKCVVESRYNFVKASKLFKQESAVNGLEDITPEECEDRWVEFASSDETCGPETTSQQETNIATIYPAPHALETTSKEDDVDDFGSPQLRLPFSDLDLDELLRALPEPEDDAEMDQTSCSDDQNEMRYVLSVLANPSDDPVVDRGRYDNFLKEVESIGQLGPSIPPPSPATIIRSHRYHVERRYREHDESIANSTIADSSLRPNVQQPSERESIYEEMKDICNPAADDDDDWEYTRQNMKAKSNRVSRIDCKS